MALIPFLLFPLDTLLFHQVNGFLNESGGRRLGSVPRIWLLSEVAQPGCCCARQDLGWGGAGGSPGVWLGAWPVLGQANGAELRGRAQPGFAAAS